MHSQLYVNGRAGLLSPAGIRTYRQSGIVIARNLLSNSLILRLASVCREIASLRGTRVFPGIDDEHNGRVDFDARMTPKPTANLAAQEPPQELQEEIRRQDEARSLERHYRKVLLKCRNMKEVERVYAKLAAQREKYMKFKKVENYATPEEEYSGRTSDRRIREIGEQYQYEHVKQSFEDYRASGKMEMEVRRDCHIDRALEHLQNWGKCWCRVWQESIPLKELLLLNGELGTVVGEAAAALAGEIVIRLFDDAVYDEHNFLNGTPFHFVGSSTNFRSVNSMTVFVGLTPNSSKTLVIPGSHNIMREVTCDGRDFSRFHTSGVFDMGRAIRNIPSLKELPVIQLEPLEPGSVLFMNHYTVNAAQATMCGSAETPYIPPSARIINNPYLYAMTLMTDRCVFDGLRNSWTSRDSHGPLYKYEAGQPLVDDDLFPVLHRALDVE